MGEYHDLKLKKNLVLALLFYTYISGRLFCLQCLLQRWELLRDHGINLEIINSNHQSLDIVRHHFIFQNFNLNEKNYQEIKIFFKKDSIWPYYLENI